MVIQGSSRSTIKMTKPVSAIAVTLETTPGNPSGVPMVAVSQVAVGEHSSAASTLEVSSAGTLGP